MIKHAITQSPVLDLIKERWSARSFSHKEVTKDAVHTILEAASWAPSANNEQPWEFQYALRGTPGFDTIWNCLMPGNQPWNKQAAGFIVTIARKTLSANGNPNANAEHDTGIATGFLVLQASSMGIYTHPMGGVDKVKLSAELNITEDEKLLCVISFGYLDVAEKLEEPFKGRELTARTRKPLVEFVKAV
ncbi:nitroreductase family protein [Cytophaga hutchinsonii]|uniref:Nitroreductase family protein n=1 Tax=Cytophaga hutchinsonii (strain ATCC 33406 / DSM 1761 / CIP 103989 / NBRC 15051 / NCIMB 9469 / D465) TaxID=269798 RepID=A0A6N4SSG2_CYTH3|nr:nitroreductase family protein [Cytophaga hutchinsonii]ABG59358.1 nitroreductase family protein [Cytophaga hutchinsonii ATCC 33406]SFX92322.1 Nitroreductase [Cytophaga hutchinsonii ATCC 33406]